MSATNPQAASAPPRAGPQGPRPPDPNRFKAVDMYAEGTEGDIEYQRMVKDIEEMQQRQGWLTSRGAFDKADLLYLRDAAEQQHHLEMEQQDQETAAFAAARARIEREEALEAMLPLKKSTAGRGPAAKAPAAKASKPLVAPLVKVKTAGQNSSSSSGQPVAKKARIEQSGSGGQAQASTPGAGGSGQAPSAAAAAAEPDSEEGSPGLGVLLGDYGSGSDSEADSEGAAAARGAAEQRGNNGKAAAGAAGIAGVQLPSAEEALARAQVWDPDQEKEPEEPRQVGYGLPGAADDTAGLLDWGDEELDEQEQREAAAGQGHDRQQQQEPQQRRWI